MVDVTDPQNPVVLGFLKTTTVPSSWRDMKVYKGYAYIGAESVNHGLQVRGGYCAQGNCHICFICIPTHPPHPLLYYSTAQYNMSTPGRLLLTLPCCVTDSVQVFDLSQLTTASRHYRQQKQGRMSDRNVTELGHVNLGIEFTPTVLYTEFGACPPSAVMRTAFVM